MASFISKKLSLFLLLCAGCIALSIVLLLNYTLAGPKLGRLYDTLLGLRSSPPVSAEILVIETGEVIEPGDIFAVLMALSEMGAGDLVVEVPVLGTGSGIAETNEELGYRVNDEFDLLGRNIRSLFEAIRLGMVSPVESPAYVDNLVELTERGRDRLNSAIARQDEAGSVSAARAEEVFGRTTMAMDMRPPPLSGAATADIPWYSRPQPDRDGKVRRIAPSAYPLVAVEADHIVYRALKPRWEKSSVEQIDLGLFLVNTYTVQEKEIRTRFPLDRNGNILLERKRNGHNGFRRLMLDHFRGYEQTGRVLGRLLKDSEALGVYAMTVPERRPLILYEYAENLKEELLKSPGESRRVAWINAREEYIISLEEFLYGPAEMSLVNGYEELIASEGLGEEGIARLRGLRDGLIRAFVAMREQHRQLVGLRTMLSAEVDGAFCIMGSPLYTESSALLANTLLTGYCITPGHRWYGIIWPLIAAFILLAGIHALRPALVLTLGFAASLFCGAIFGLAFILTGYWFDPLIPTAACWGGILFLAVSRYCIGHGRMFRFRLAYAGLVNASMLRQLLKAGRPLLSESLYTQAVIVAVKNPGMTAREDRVTPQESARAATQFRREFTHIFKQQNALILGFENDVALACFGSPPQRICKEEKLHPAANAVPGIREIMNNPLTARWHFGIESGDCVFSWPAGTAYTANGHAAIRARIFASLALKYNVRAVIGESAREGSGYHLKKLASLAGKNFYELPA
jgi:hypothetical protein